MEKMGSLWAFDGADKPLRLERANVRRLKQGEVLVKNSYTTLCGSDIHTYCGKRAEKTPTVLGHEIVGNIEEFATGHPRVDFNGEALDVGDFVTWAVFTAEPQTYWIEKKMPQKSARLFKYGHAMIENDDVFHGGLSEFTILKPHTAIFKLPPELPKSIASTINCAVATVSGALRLAGDLKGRNVLITGLGLLGNLTASMCKVSGAASIIAVDLSQERLDQAIRFGATNSYLTSSGLELKSALLEHGIDVVFEMSGAPDAAELGLDVLQTGGIAIWIGSVFKTRKIAVDAEQVIRRLLTIKGLHNYNFEDIQCAVEFIKRYFREFPFEEIVGREFSFAEAAEAFDYAIEHKPLRVGIAIDSKI